MIIIGPKLQCCGSGSAWIRKNFCLDPELYSSGSGSSKKWKSRSIKLWILDCFYWRTVVWNRKWQIVVKTLLFDWNLMCIIIISKYFINKGWLRIRMDLELLPGSGTRKIQSWNRNISFRFHQHCLIPNNHGSRTRGLTVDGRVTISKMASVWNALCPAGWSIWCV